MSAGYLAYDNVLRGDDRRPLALATPDPSAAATTAPSAGRERRRLHRALDHDLRRRRRRHVDRHRRQPGRLPRPRAARQPRRRVGRRGAHERRDRQITVVETAGGAQLTAGEIAIDTTTITSDEDRRDNRLRTEGLQTDQFPTATFMLTQPVDVPAAAIAGTATDVTLVGDLTLHGVTKSVEIPAQAQLTDGQIQVAGSLTFPLADFDITAPNVGGFIISIADEGALEFLVVFAKA